MSAKTKYRGIVAEAIKFNLDVKKCTNKTDEIISNIETFDIENIKNQTDSKLAYASVSYEDFNMLKSEVETLNQATNKAMDLSLALQTKVSEFDLFFYGTIKKEIESLWQYVETMSNHIKELENKQKGFIRRFFDRFKLIKRDDLDIKKHKSRQSFTLNDD